jgi:uncharacterized membrane protein YbhN (UPF0104 family)
MKPPRRIYRYLRWVVALMAIVFVARQLTANPEPLQRLLRTGPGVLAGLCGLVVLNQALMSVRFALAMNQTGAGGVSLGTWFRLTSIGQMLNLFVPQLGNVYRAVTLRRDYGISYLGYATGLVSFVWLDMVMGVVIAILVIGGLEPGLRFAGAPALALLLAGLLVIFFGPIVAAFVLARLPSRSGWLGKMQARLTTLLATASAAARSPSLMLRFFLLNAVVTAGQTATLWLAFHSVGGSIPLSGLVLFQILVKLSSQVVLTPGNLGITELAFGALAHGSASTLEQGLAVSLLLRAVGSAMVFALGVLSGGADALFGGRRALLEQNDQLIRAPGDSS